MLTVHEIDTYLLPALRETLANIDLLAKDPKAYFEPSLLMIYRAMSTVDQDMASQFGFQIIWHWATAALYYYLPPTWRRQHSISQMRDLIVCDEVLSKVFVPLPLPSDPVHGEVQPLPCQILVYLKYLELGHDRFQPWLTELLSGISVKVVEVVRNVIIETASTERNKSPDAVFHPPMEIRHNVEDYVYCLKRSSSQTSASNTSLLDQMQDPSIEELASVSPHREPARPAKRARLSVSETGPSQVDLWADPDGSPSIEGNQSSIRPILKPSFVLNVTPPPRNPVEPAEHPFTFSQVSSSAPPNPQASAPPGPDPGLNRSPRMRRRYANYLSSHKFRLQAFLGQGTEDTSRYWDLRRIDSWQHQSSLQHEVGRVPPKSTHAGYGQGLTDHRQGQGNEIDLSLRKCSSEERLRHLRNWGLREARNRDSVPANGRAFFDLDPASKSPPALGVERYPPPHDAYPDYDGDPHSDQLDGLSLAHLHLEERDTSCSRGVTHSTHLARPTHLTQSSRRRASESTVRTWLYDYVQR